MNLLLLLSALLSALTGVATGVRAPSATQEISQVGMLQAEPASARITLSTRPVDPMPGLLAVALAPHGEALRLDAAIPPFMGRRRE